MADISSLSKTSTQLQQIIKASAKDTSNISIDAHTLEQYPVTTNRDFYLGYEKATSLTLDGIAEDDIPAIMSCFQRMQRLTMTNILILDNIDVFPRSLTDLTLIKVQIEDELFQELLSNNKDSLKSLHLDQLETQWSKSAEWSYDFEQLCPHVDCLIIKGGLNYMRSHGNLEIKSNKPTLAGKLPPHLKHFHLEASIRNLNLHKMTELKTCTLLIMAYGVPVTVEHLKCIKAIDFGFKKQIDEHFKGTLDVAYYNCSKSYMGRQKPRAKPNQMLTLLTNDLLLKITEYLDTRSCFALSEAHPRFMLWNTNVPFLKKVNFNQHITEKSLWFAPVCTTLEMKNVSLAKKKNIKWNMFEHMLNQLTILQELSVDDNLGMNWQIDLLKRNRDTLKVFRIRFTKPGELSKYESLWEAISEIPRIDHIEILAHHMMFNDELSKTFIVGKLFSLIEKQLKILTIDTICPPDLVYVYAPLLQELNYCEKVTAADLIWLSRLRELRKLTIGYFDDSVTQSDIFKLIKKMKKLQELTLTVPFNLGLRFGATLRAYLQQEGRVLRFTAKGD